MFLSKIFSQFFIWKWIVLWTLWLWASILTSKIWKGDIDLWTAQTYQSDWLNTLLIINFLDICWESNHIPVSALVSWKVFAARLRYGNSSNHSFAFISAPCVNNRTILLSRETSDQLESSPVQNLWDQQQKKNRTNVIHNKDVFIKLGEGVGGEVLWLILWLICCVCAADLSEPYTIIVYSVANYRPRPSHFRANVIFAIPILVTF